MIQIIFYGIISIIENLQVKNIIIGTQYEISENYIEFIKLISEKKINTIEVEKDNILKLDKNTYIEVLWPNSNYIIQENKINNNSLVFKITSSNTSILFTGDIEEKAEKEILKEYAKNLKSDILKVAHHGSNSSSYEKFLEAVNPKIALIGVGVNNKFGHPSIETIEKLEKLNSIIYRTDINGEIRLKKNKNQIFLKY